MDNPGTTQTNGSPKASISAGMTLPPWKAGGGHPSPFSVGDMNLRDAVMNAFLNLAVKISQVDPNQDGTFTPSGNLTISDLNSILELKFSPGTGGNGTANIIPMQVVSYTTTNEYLSAKMGSFTAADTFTATGSAINVALPWVMRPAQAPPGASLSPAYAANDIILVLATSAGQNGVYVSSTELLYIDLGLGRTWLNQIGSQRYFLVSTFSDYWVCKDLASGYNWPIAKPDELRCSIAALTLEGISTTYAYTGFTSPTNYQWLRRTVTHGSDSPVIEGITPVPLFNSSVPSPTYKATYIYADSPTGGTGVVIASGDTTLYGPTASTLTAGTAVTLMDRNNGGRAWSVLVSQSGEGA